MAKIKWKGGALIAPVPPAMISCMGKDGKPNIITVAWTGILCTHPPKTYISVRPSRHSYELIRESGEFVINLTTAALTKSADFCGMKTGRKVDKFKECKLTADFDANFEDFFNRTLSDFAKALLWEDYMDTDCGKPVTIFKDHHTFRSKIRSSEPERYCNFAKDYIFKATQIIDRRTDRILVLLQEKLR